MGDRVRVVIVDDHRVLREGLRVILSTEEWIEIVGEAAHGLEAIEVVSRLQPDVGLLDITMPGTDGIEAIRLLKQNSLRTKLLILTAAMDDDSIFQALLAGAKGYLSKDSSASDLLKAIQVVHQGQLWVESKLITRFFEREALIDGRGEDGNGRTSAALTSKEYEVLRLLAAGATNKEIAQALFISEKTVKCHLTSMFRKFNVTGRTEAILYAIHQGLIRNCTSCQYFC